MDRLEGRMDGLHAELRHQTRTFVIAMSGTVATSSSIAFAAASIV